MPGVVAESSKITLPVVLPPKAVANATELPLTSKVATVPSTKVNWLETSVEFAIGYPNPSKPTHLSVPPFMVIGPVPASAPV